MHKLFGLATIGCLPLLTGCEQKSPPHAPPTAPGSLAKGSTPAQSKRAGEPAKVSNEPAATPGEEEQGGSLAIVLLRTSPAELQASRVQDFIRQEFGDAVASTMLECGDNSFITAYMFDADSHFVLVQACVKPYVQPQHMSAAAAAIPHAEARDGFLRHSAFVSVDFIGSPKGSGMTAEQVLDRLGKVAAELRDDECVAVYSTCHGEYIPVREATAARLRAGNVAELFPSGARVLPDNHDMGEAVGPARELWPQFVNAWNNRRGECIFVVRARFEEPEGFEHMWVRVERIAGTSITGELGDHPRIFRRAKQGDFVTVERSQISDWAYRTPAGSDGGFTDPFVRELFTRKSK